MTASARSSSSVISSQRSWTSSPSSNALERLGAEHEDLGMLGEEIEETILTRQQSTEPIHGTAPLRDGGMNVYPQLLFRLTSADATQTSSAKVPPSSGNDCRRALPTQPLPRRRM